LVQENVLSLDAGRVPKKPVVQPIERRTFQDTGGAIKLRGGMISNEDVAGFTLDSFVHLGACFVFRCLAGKSKVDERPCHGTVAERV
jgi:hypothetical protein